MRSETRRAIGGSVIGGVRAGPPGRGHGLRRGLDLGGAWTSETQHDAFLPLILATQRTTRLELGTSIAVAFGRSPIVTAHLAWDLAALSQGRFLLGLGTQVKGHIERRYGLTWDAPGPRLRDYITALRAIWDCWQHGTPLNYRGEFYSHTLMTPFFNPGPIAHPRIPVHIQVHPFHSVKYLREVVLPNVEQGLTASDRKRADICLASSAFIVTGRDAADMEAARRSVKSQIGFYASTPNYRVILDCHGWGQVAKDLTRRSVQGDWEGMAALITDEMLDAFAVVATPDEVPGKLRQRYTGLLDRLAVYETFRPEADLTAQRALLAAFPR
ncbi:MAG: LLM class flavin-dependent oxidoreductase [candidate division NC10 bacterium]|nr:LLM class flavin-dependent oxidoreductase [candidate division NC10 bacterium]